MRFRVKSLIDLSLWSDRRANHIEARDLAIYLLRYVRGERLGKIGEEFNLSNYSSVSNAISRVKRRLHNHKFKKIYGKIYDSL